MASSPPDPRFPEIPRDIFISAYQQILLNRRTVDVIRTGTTFSWTETNHNKLTNIDIPITIWLFDGLCRLLIHRFIDDPTLDRIMDECEDELNRENILTRFALFPQGRERAIFRLNPPSDLDVPGEYADEFMTLYDARRSTVEDPETLV